MSITCAFFEKMFPSLQRSMQTYGQRVTDSLEVSKPKNHLLVLDGVRAMAFLLVLLHHITEHIVLPIYWTGFWNPSGRLQTLLAAALNVGESGVILFFLLSSFLLFLPFAKAILFDGQWPSVSRFYLRRAFRIIPGYYAALFLMILFFHPEFLHATNRMQIWTFLTFTMSGQLSGQLNGPFWTLAVEFQFYMILPLVAWILSLIVRHGTLRWRLTKLVSSLLILLGWGLLSRWWGLVLDPQTTSFPQNAFAALHPYLNGDFFDTFAVGMLLAVLYVYTQHAPKGELLYRKLQRWSSWMFLVSLVILGFLAIWHMYFVDIINGQNSTAFAFLGPLSTFKYQVYVQWYAICFSIGYSLSMCALVYGSGQIKRFFEWSVLRWIGLISFSLYMWHFPLLILFRNLLNNQFQGLGGGVKLVAVLAWVIFVIFPISLTLYRWVEMPGMRLGELLIQRIEKSKKKQSINIYIDAQEVSSIQTVPFDEYVRHGSK